jgi:hypothetical protein
LVPPLAGPSALERHRAGTDGVVTSLRVYSESEWVAVGAGRNERAEYPGGIVVLFRRLIAVMVVTEIIRGLV